MLVPDEASGEGTFPHCTNGSGKHVYYGIGHKWYLNSAHTPDVDEVNSDDHIEDPVLTRAAFARNVPRGHWSARYYR